MLMAEEKSEVGVVALGDCRATCVVVLKAVNRGKYGLSCLMSNVITSCRLMSLSRDNDADDDDLGDEVNGGAVDDDAFSAL